MPEDWLKKMWYVHKWDVIQTLKKEGNPAIFNNMDEPGGHYAKWSKPDTGQILHSITSIRNLK